MILPPRLRQAVSGWVYPPICAVCDQPLSTSEQLELPFLCLPCREKLVPVGDDYCRICGQSYETPMPFGTGCANCGDRELAIDFAVGAYRNSGVARELMHRLKYGRDLPLARTMGTLLQRVWQDDRLLEPSGWWVVPIPLHPKRLRERGFNQSSEIASAFLRQARESGADLPALAPFSGLKRNRHCEHQARLDRRDRLHNVVEAFVARKKSIPPGKRKNWGFLLVDDVVTTGSTVSECAAILRRNWGAERIAAISPLRG